jgi:uncharacterized membrane protein HdeD (DUF308 family)
MPELKVNLKIHKTLMYVFGVITCVLGFWMTTSPLVQISLQGLRLC